MTTASLQSLGYLPVATATLRADTMLECDLYLQRRGCSFVELYRSSNYPLETADLDRLRKDGVDHLYIRLEEADAYRTYLCQNVLRQRDIPIGVRLKALREVTRVAFQEALSAHCCDGLVQVACGIAPDLASMLAVDAAVFGELFTAIEHDYGTFTHACNVSIYAAMIARRMDGFDVQELPQLIVGGLLHDIGKRHLSRYLINKAGKLTDDEWELIRAHPTAGFRELRARGDLSWGQLMMVYQHHERLDGSGYPAGIVNDEIHLWARICAVADVFDAMSCQRPYRRGLPLDEVCKYFSRHSGTRYDAAVIECWLGQMLATSRR